MIEAAKEIVNFVEADGIQIRDLADCRPVIWVIRWKECSNNRHGRQAVRPILVTLAPLVQHDVPLVREPRFGQCRKQVPHPVRLHPQRQLEGVRWHDLPIIGAVGVGRPVESGAGRLKRLKVATVVMLRPFEHQVLEEVRKSSMARPLVLRSDVIPEVDRHDRARAILV
jgi:hypothetical protein